jgi:hypothetical protein
LTPDLTELRQLATRYREEIDGAGSGGWHPPLPRVCAVVSGRRLAREVAEHQPGDLAPKVLAGVEVDHGVLPGDEPAERGLVGRRLEAVKVPGPKW